MKSLSTAAVAAVAICGLTQVASGFSPPGPISASDNSISTERNYGMHVDAEVSFDVNNPILVYPSGETERGTATAKMDALKALSLDDDTLTNKITTPKTRKRRRRQRTVMRPTKNSNKLHSPSSTIKKNKYPSLLTRKDEGKLTNRLRALRAAIRVRDKLVSDHPNPLDCEIHWQPSETEWALACGLSVSQLRRVMNEGQQARAKLVDSNGGLVHSIAKKYYYSLKQANMAGGGLGSILTLQDMVQEGNLGLMEAAERFEPERGFRFSTYATYWVRQRIMRSISEYSRVIRLPAHVHSMVRKIHKARKAMTQEIGRSPSDPELAHYMEMSVEKLRKYTDSSRTVLSLERAVNPGDYKGEDKRTLGDRIASDSPSPQEDAEVESLRRAIRDVVNELAERERDVLVARFGLDDGTPKTVEETSKRLGISRDRVRLVETRALNKLRHPQRNYKLKDYVGGGDNGADEEQQSHELNLSPERIWSF